MSDPAGPPRAGSPSAARLREQILALTREYAAANWPAKSFDPGKDPVPVSGKVFDGDDVASLVDASLDFWLTTGRFAARFEQEFAAFMGVPFVLLANSGSSANLLAVSALTSPLLGDRQLKPGDEVLTLASGFPTTVNPIIQNGLVPVFMDSHIATYNVDPGALDAAMSPKVRAVIFAHTLGNPFDAAAVREFADRNNLWFIEDCCDAVGAEVRGRKVGTFGDLATVSFYPAHHLTMGEGGAVLVNKPVFKRLIESFRDWGRDCWCDPGNDNTCGKRFGWQLGELPEGYDHKYTYNHVGYNLKLTDMQAAVGLAQLKKLPGFIKQRAENFAYLEKKLEDLKPFLILPEVTVRCIPSWFGMPLTLRPTAGITRLDLIQKLEAAQVKTRLFFGGNLVRQPAYRDVPKRIVGTLANADLIMNQSFWVGIYPGLTRPMLDHISATLHEILR
jgi:CDP-6-deoxy-D-xylo-4-hexulose-3-dehydrase